MQNSELTKSNEQILLERQAKDLRDDLNHDPELKRELSAFLSKEKKLDDTSVVTQDYLRDIGKVARAKKMKEADLRLALGNLLSAEVDREAEEIVADLDRNPGYRKEVLVGLKSEIVGPKTAPSEQYRLYMYGIQKICEEKVLDFLAVKQKIYALLKKENIKEVLKGRTGNVRERIKRIGVPV